MSTLTIDELERFTLVQDADEESRTSALLDDSTIQYTCALVVGRFQPLHRGHIHLIRSALRIASSVVICIGSANITDADNPFTVDTRIHLLKRALERENLSHLVKTIFILDDLPDDTEWIDMAIQKAGVIDVVVGNNEWVNTLFLKAGYPVFEIPMLNRTVYEGKTIRDQLRTDGVLK